MIATGKVFSFKKKKIIIKIKNTPHWLVVEQCSVTYKSVALARTLKSMVCARSHPRELGYPWLH